MARFKVVERSFIGNRIVDAGAIVEIEFKDGGVAGPNLEAIAPEKTRKKVTPATLAEAVEQGEDGSNDLT